MASIKITELTETAEIGTNDVLPIVDVFTNETKKIKGINISGGNYSTNEVKTNKRWIDGKPIYRKVITANDLLPDEGYNTKAITHGISNIDKITNIKCLAENTSYDYFDFNNYSFIENNQWCTTHVLVNDTYIIVAYVNGYISYVSKAYFILEYTKTTD